MSFVFSKRAIKLREVVIVGKYFRIKRREDLAQRPERVTCLRDLLIDHGFERSVQPVDGPFTASGHR